MEPQEQEQEATPEVGEAARLAAANPTPEPAILISGQGAEERGKGNLTLILVKDSQALAQTISSLDNLEDNISILTELAQQKFNQKVSALMTIGNVSKEVETKLDDLTDSQTEIRQVRVDTPFTLGKGGTKEGSAVTRWVVITLVILALGAGGYFFKDQVIERFSPPAPTPTPIPTPIPTPEPSPTPLPIVDRGQYKLRVLNGTATTGAAKTLADKLKGLGWQVPNTGNATSSAVALTQIRLKPSLSTISAMLAEDLRPQYSPTIGDDLLETDRVDGEVVIGGE